MSEQTKRTNVVLPQINQPMEVKAWGKWIQGEYVVEPMKSFLWSDAIEAGWSPLLTLSPTAQQAFDMGFAEGVWMAAEAIDTRHVKVSKALREMDEAINGITEVHQEIILALTTPADTVTLTREELKALLYDVAEAVNYCSGQDLRAIVAKHMPKGEK